MSKLKILGSQLFTDILISIGIVYIALLGALLLSGSRSVLSIFFAAFGLMLSGVFPLVAVFKNVILIFPLILLVGVLWIICVKTKSKLRILLLTILFAVWTAYGALITAYVVGPA